MNLLDPSPSHPLIALRYFQDEAKNLISLQHPHIVKYHDVFVHRDIETKAQREADQTKTRAGFGGEALVALKQTIGAAWGADDDATSTKKAKQRGASGSGGEFDQLCPLPSLSCQRQPNHAALD